VPVAFCNVLETKYTLDVAWEGFPMIRMIASLLSLLVLPAYAQAANEVGIFGPDCSTSNLTVAANSSLVLNICAHLNGMPDPQSCLDPGVEVACRVLGLPDSWSVSLTPNPEATFLKDDPLGTSGGEIVVPLDASSTVVLYTLTVTAPAEAAQAELSLQGTAEECPMTRYMAQNCDGAPVCAETHPFTLVVDPLVPVRRSTWAMLKVRYHAP
jgi:hypothetical protein